MNKKLLSIIFLLFIMTSCKKEDTVHTLEGYIYKNCDKEPYIGLHLTVEGVNYRPLQSTEKIYLGEFTTDKNGYYSMVYETDKYFDGLNFLSNSKSIIQTPFKEKLSFIHYKNPIVNHNVILHVEDSLSKEDTIYFGATMNGTQFILAGPFKEGQVIPIQIRPNIGLNAGNDFISGDRVGKGLFWWGLGWEEYQKVSSNPNFQVPPNMIRGPLQPMCGQGENIIVDLRGKTGK